VDVEAPGRDLEQDRGRGNAVLADECDAIVRVDRDDRDRSGVAGDVARRARSVGPFDRVDAEGQVAAMVEDA
jgi:hypothetical protein